MPVDSNRRLAALVRHAGAEARYVWSQGGSICAPGYCESAEYRLHREEATANLAEAARLCADEGIELAVENLNPRVTYLFQLPAELVRLVHALPQLRLCVDLGHLWISSLVHGFDFLRGLRDLARHRQGGERPRARQRLASRDAGRRAGSSTRRPTEAASATTISRSAGATSRSRQRCTS